VRLCAGRASSAIASGRIERLLQGANEAIALPHRLRLIDLEARHRVAQYRSHYNPNQPRVPAGHPDGGQWTATGGLGTRLAAADKPRPGRGGIIAIAVQLALRAIEAYRVKERLWDLLGNTERSAIAVTTIDGKDVFGANSESRAYTSADFAAAKRLRSTRTMQNGSWIKEGAE
jgi:hypothetical protein